MFKRLYIFFLLFFVFYSCTDNRTDYQKANDFLKEKNYDKAVVYFLRTIKSGVDDNPILYKKLSIAYLKSGKLKEAEKYVYKAIKLSPEDEEIVSLYVDILLKRKSYYKALNLIKLLPESLKKYKNLIDLNLAVHNIKNVFEYMDKALEFIENDNEKIKFKYGIALKILKLNEFCIEKNQIFKDLSLHYKDSVEFLKNYYNALSCKYENKISNRSVIGRYDESKSEREKLRLEILKKLVKSDKNNVYYYNELAQIYIDKRDMTNARKTIRKSKSIDNKQDILLFLEAQTDFLRDRYESVIEKMEKYLKNNKNLKALKMLAKSYYMKADYKNAIKYYKILLKEEPYNKDNLYKLEEIYEYTKDEEGLKDIRYKIKYFRKRFYK